MKRLTPVVGVALSMLAAAGAGFAPMALHAQQRPLQNLQVLPSDLPRDSVTAIMGGFTRALGVNCVHCHVARNGTRPAPDEWALDDKETKRVAREMMRMVSAINETHLAATQRTIANRHRVTCATCHHGLALPRALDVALVDKYEATGIDSTVALYRTLRERYFGRAAYDFSDITLPTAADQLAVQPDRRADALTLMRLNLEFHPDSWFTYQQMGQLQMALGDAAGAIASYQRAIEINPRRPQLRELLEEAQARRP